MTPGLVFLAKSRNLTKILHELYTIGRSFDSVARITLLDNQLFSIFSGQATTLISEVGSDVAKRSPNFTVTSAKNVTWRLYCLPVC